MGKERDEVGRQEDTGRATEQWVAMLPDICTNECREQTKSCPIGRCREAGVAGCLVVRMHRPVGCMGPWAA